jgi:Domain of unknown function (DUF4214)
MSTFTTGFTTPYFSYTDPASAAQSFADLKSTGANSVVIDFPLYQDSLTSNSVTYQTGSTLENLSTLIALAKQEGLDVWIKPLLIIGSAPGQWWNIAPTDPNAWFQSYDKALVSIGQTIQPLGVSHYLLANELVSMWDPKFNDQWASAISQVRSVFSGPIGFDTPGPGEEPGDANNNPAFNLSLYNLLDFVGLDMYPVFKSTTGSFTAAEVQNGWTSDAFGQNLTQALEGFFARVHLPVYLTEFGDPAILNGNYAFYSSGNYSAGPNNTVDPQGQAIFYNTSLNYIENTFAGSINGVFIYDWELNENNTPIPGTEGYAWDVFGKPAQGVITAAFGGTEFLKPFDSSFVGSIANDRIVLFGSQFPNASSQPQTFSTTITIDDTGNIINGQTPKLHFYIDGIDMGAQSLPAIPNIGYTDPNGVFWSGAAFTFTLPGLVNISQLKIVFEGSPNLGGVENSITFLHGVSVDGVPLVDATYFPATGAAQQQTIDVSTTQWDAGYTLIDATPWNSDLSNRAIGTPAQPLHVDGGGGTDVVHVLGHFTDYAFAGLGTRSVAISEHSGLDQNAVLNDISYLVFQDGEVMQIGPVANGGIAGTAASDFFYSFGTNLSITGGGGHDTLNFDGSSSQYVITNNGDGSVTVTDSVAGRDFSHHVTQVEDLQFTDQNIFVENADNANIARLYSAALGRSPDQGGLFGWEDIYANNIPSPVKAQGVYAALAQTNDGYGTTIAGGFTQSVEFISKYGALDDTGFLTQLYANVLGRAPDPGGLSGWLNLMHGGGFTRDMVLVGFAESPENMAKTAADWLIQV